jgi:hypothetical protein
MVIQKRLQLGPFAAPVARGHLFENLIEPAALFGAVASAQPGDYRITQRIQVLHGSFAGWTPFEVLGDPINGLFRQCSKDKGSQFIAGWTC